MRARIDALVITAVVSSTARAQWCPANLGTGEPVDKPTAANYNCGNKQGLACPMSSPVCRTTATGAVVNGIAQKAACDSNAATTWYRAEYGSTDDSWDSGGGAKWAGHEIMVCPSGTVAKKCDGNNECSDDGKCRIEGTAPNQQVVCSLDELGCGGLVDMVTTGALYGLSVDQGQIAVASATEEVTLTHSLEISLGPGLSSEWIKPYGATVANNPAQYSHADCTGYSELAVTEPGLSLTYTNIAFTQTNPDVADADALKDGVGGQTFGVTTLPNVAGCNNCASLTSCGDCSGEVSQDTELGLTLVYTPPPNFIGTVKFDYQLQSPDGAVAGTSTATGTVQLHVGLTQCIKCMTNATAEGCHSSSNYCGEHGTCTGPQGCSCAKGWFGERCDVPTEAMQDGEYTWGGWGLLIFIVFASAAFAGFVIYVNRKGIFIKDALSNPFVPQIPPRSSQGVSSTAEVQVPAIHAGISRSVGGGGSGGDGGGGVTGRAPPLLHNARP